MKTIPPRPHSNNKKPKVTRYRSTSWPGHPLCQGDGRKVYVHRAVLYEKIGSGGHNCHHCSRRVYWRGKGIKRLVADHLDLDRWNNDPANLVPACRKCNSDRVKNPKFMTHCAAGHEYTPENTYVRPDGAGRVCRACNRRRDTKQRRKRARR